jgi:hypothetical protein
MKNSTINFGDLESFLNCIEGLWNRDICFHADGSALRVTIIAQA